LLELSENLPIRIEIVDIAERMDRLLTELGTMIGEGLVTIGPVHSIKYLADPH
jgi:PII-like signaling protein